jgi:hypothetical protein
LLEEAGFRLVESRVILTRLVEKANVEDRPFPGGTVRWARRSDMKAMHELARANLFNGELFRSRFKNPAYFSPEDADRYFSTWIDNFTESEGFDCAVIEVGDRVVGYQLYSRAEPYAGETRYLGTVSAIAAEFRGTSGLPALHSFIFRNLPEDRFYFEGRTQLTNFAVLTARLRNAGRIESVEHIFYRRRGATPPT